MKSIRLQNLRSLKDTGYIKTEGLTIIAGENSVGKSTILRSLPLIKQSIETKTTSPFLWYGNYVDFGSFKESLNRNSEDSRIVFTFEFDLPIVFRRITHRYDYSIENDESPKYVKIELFVNGKEKSDYINEIKITVIDNHIDILIDNKARVIKATINNEDMTEIMKDYVFINPITGIIPDIYVKRDVNSKFEFTYYGWRYSDNKFLIKLVNLIKSKVNSKTSGEKIYDIIGHFKIQSKELFISNILRSGQELISWDKFLKSPESKKCIEHMRNLYIGVALNDIFISISEYLNIFANAISYIAPIRANANRYYRNQNLSVESVDFQGINLPMLLANLSPANKKEFSMWVNENFGFEVITKMSEGH